MKKLIIGLIIGGIIFGTIGVLGATYLYHANQVSYSPSNSNFNVDNVESAINDLYDITNTPLTYKNITSIVTTGSGSGTWTFHVESDVRIDVVVAAYGYTYNLNRSQMYIWKRSDPNHLYVLRGDGEDNVGVNNTTGSRPILFEDFAVDNGWSSSNVKVDSINYTDKMVEFTVATNGYSYKPTTAIIF